MERKLKKIFKILILSFILLFSFKANVFAEVVSFKVILDPTTIEAWQAVDITIKAIDENGDIDKNYTWTIGLVEWINTTPWEVDFFGFADSVYPSYTFTSSDEWVKKFENSIKFLKPWNKAIAVASEDVSNDDWPTWEADITVTWWGVTTEEISITSPSNNETIWKNSVKILWEAKKNYKVKIKLNDNKTYSVVADSSGIFNKELTELPDWTNIIQALLLDGDENIIGKSKKITFEVNSVPPISRGFTIDPEDNIKSWDTINVEVLTQPDMEVSITVDDAVYSLTEDMEWKHIWNFPAPDKAWDYPIDLEISDDMWNKNEQKAAKTITVIWEKVIEKEKEPVKKKEKIKKEEKAVTKTWACEETKISWLKLTELKTKSILSWDKVEDATGYRVFKKDWEAFNLIENIKENRYTIFIKEAKEITYEDFAIKAICKKEWKEIDSKEYSDVTKIQTWPTETVLFILFSLLLSGLYFIFFRKKQS